MVHLVVVNSMKTSSAKAELFKEEKNSTKRERGRGRWQATNLLFALIGTCSTAPNSAVAVFVR